MVWVGLQIVAVLIGSLLAAFLLGAGMAAVSIRLRTSRKPPGGLGLYLIAVVVAVVLSVVLDGFQIVSMAWHVTAATIGWTVVAMTMRAVRAGAVGIAIEVGLIAGVAVIALVLITDVNSPANLSFAPSRTPVDNLRALVKELPREPSEVWELDLTPDEVNAVLSSTLAVRKTGAMARIDMLGDVLIANGGFALRAGSVERFFNLRAGLVAGGDERGISLNLRWISLGGISWPRFLVHRIDRAANQWVRTDSRWGRMLALIDDARFDGGRITIRGRNASDFRRLALGEMRSQPGHAVTASRVRHYVAILFDGADRLPAGDARFCELLKEVFAEASRQSAMNDPVEENRAALVALAVALGNNSVGAIVGVTAADGAPLVFPYGIQRDVTLRDRRDLALHYIVSAALTAVASDQAADSAGFTKEYLDAQSGGSGFSFADLTADRAGTRLAQLAVASPESAQRMQALVGNGVSTDDVIPTIDGLAEGIDAATLFADFGSYSDPRFLAAIAEVDGRVARCRLYR